MVDDDLRRALRTLVELREDVERQATDTVGRWRPWVSRDEFLPSARVRIMVTLPAEAVGDQSLTRDLLLAGTECFRINCAHDDVDTWERMVWNIRAGEAETGRSAMIGIDLAGHPAGPPGAHREGPGRPRLRGGARGHRGLLVRPDPRGHRPAPARAGWA